MVSRDRLILPCFLIIITASHSVEGKIFRLISKYLKPFFNRVALKIMNI